MIDADDARADAGDRAQRLDRPPGGPHPERDRPRPAPGRLERAARASPRGAARRRCTLATPSSCSLAAAIEPRSVDERRDRRTRSRGPSAVAVRRIRSRACSPTDLAYAGAAEQARLIREGEVVGARGRRGDARRRSPRSTRVLSAYRVVFAERALAEADAIDAGGTSRPLAGVPVAIKDDADVAGEITAWGTSAYGDPKAVDSDVVVRLREAGAIVIGKTHVPEMTMWPWTLSATFGSVRNPWGTDRTPGGSSGGSRGGTATGMCGVALGSDGGGSIRYPAALLRAVRDQDAARPHLARPRPSRRLERPQRLRADRAHRRRRGAVPRRDVDERARRRVLGGARASTPQPLRVAVSLKPPQGSLARLGAEQRGAVEETAELLRSLGHEVIEREVDLPFTLILNLDDALPARPAPGHRGRCRGPSAWSATRAGWRRSAAC